MPQYIKTYSKALPSALCESLIERFKSDDRVSADPQPDYSTRQFLNLSHCPDWLGPVANILDVTNQLAEDYFAVPEGMEEVALEDWIDDGFIMSHYKSGDHLILHVDGQNTEENCNGLRVATVLFFLCDCEGGELYFPLQDVSIKPEKGLAVIFPPGYSHPHEVLEVKSDRFIVQTWLTHPNLKVVEA